MDLNRKIGITMGWKPCKDHFRKWDQESKDIGDEEWVLVSECHTCGDPAFWEVYPLPDEDEPLAKEPLRTERTLPDG